jgi:fibronectin-binding autotransporter adhesin
LQPALAGTGTFEIAGLPVARGFALLEAGFDADVASSTTIALSYQGLIADKIQDHGFRANLEVKF